MAGSLRQYSSSESNNAALGQAGSIFINTAGAITPTSGVFVAITVIDAVEFTALVPEDGNGKQYIGQANPSDSGSGGQALGSTSIPEGITLYGRWSSINVSSGSVIAYLG